MYLLPFAERLLEFSSALSSLPGQVPTQEVNSAAEENVLAVTPTSAMICCADDAETGHFRQSYHDVLVWLHGLHDQTVQLRDLHRASRTTVSSSMPASVRIRISGGFFLRFDGCLPQPRKKSSPMPNAMEI